MWNPSASSRLSARGLRNRDGPMAATFGLITAGQAVPSADIMVGYATPSVTALQQETRSIPIVFLSVTDPVGQGLVASLARPGGNITGFAVFEISLGTKWIGALKQIAPSLKRVTTIFNPKTAPYYSLYLDAIEKAASSFAVEPIVVEVLRR